MKLAGEEKPDACRRHGGAGFIGSHLADELLDCGHTVLDNLDPQVDRRQQRPAYLRPGVELAVGDVRDEACVTRCLKGADAVVHLAAKVGVGQSSTRSGPIRASTGRHGDAAAGNDRIGLLAGRAYGVETTALRFFNVYGPRQALSNPYTGVLAIFASRLLSARPPMVFEDGRRRRDFVHSGAHR